MSLITFASDTFQDLANSVQRTHMVFLSEFAAM